MPGSHFSCVLASMRNGEFSDLTFTCEDKLFRVHKNVVCSQSPVLKALVQNTTVTDSLFNKVDLSNFSPQTVDAFVQYLYDGDFKPTMPPSAGETEVKNEELKVPELIERMISAYQIAAHYKVTPMVRLAALKVKELLRGHKDSDDLVSGLPMLVKRAASMSGKPSIMDLLAGSSAYHIEALSNNRTVSELGAVAGFFQPFMKHCAHYRNRDRQAQAALSEKLQSKEDESKGMRAALQQINEKFLCEGCKYPFNARISETWNIICQQCNFNQMFAASNQIVAPVPIAQPIQPPVQSGVLNNLTGTKRPNPFAETQPAARI